MLLLTAGASCRYVRLSCETGGRCVACHWRWRDVVEVEGVVDGDGGEVGRAPGAHARVDLQRPCPLRYYLPKQCIGIPARLHAQHHIYILYTPSSHNSRLPTNPRIPITTSPYAPHPARAGPIASTPSFRPTRFGRHISSRPLRLLCPPLRLEVADVRLNAIAKSFPAGLLPEHSSFPVLARPQLRMRPYSANPLA
jgi:hypothetical protein